jgi:creatinine amidohydrolase
MRDVQALEMRMLDKINYERMLPHEIAKAVESFPVAFVPFGSLEWHGRHLALGNDTLKALGILEATCAIYGGVVLPPTYWGCVGKWHPWTFAYMEEKTLSKLCEYIFASLADVGFKVIIGVTGHDVDEHVRAMNKALQAVKERYPIEGCMMMEGDLTDFGEHIMDHAGHWETSILMYLHPDCVDMHRIREEKLMDMNPESSEWTDPGIEGRDPRKGKANKELGKTLVEGIAEAIGKKAQALLSLLETSGKLKDGPPPGGRAPEKM